MFINVVFCVHNFKCWEKIAVPSNFDLINLEFGVKESGFSSEQDKYSRFGYLDTTVRAEQDKYSSTVSAVNDFTNP